MLCLTFSPKSILVNSNSSSSRDVTHIIIFENSAVSLTPSRFLGESVSVIRMHYGVIMTSSMMSYLSNMESSIQHQAVLGVEISCSRYKTNEKTISRL